MTCVIDHSVVLLCCSCGRTQSSGWTEPWQGRCSNSEKAFLLLLASHTSRRSTLCPNLSHPKPPASAIIAGITGGPGICHTALYDSGRLASSFPTHLAEINALIVTCRTLAAITALSVCHVVLILCWIGLDVYVVYTTISTSTSTMSRAAAFKLPMWKLIRGEYRRVDVLELGEANKVDQYGVGGSGQDGYSYGSRNRMGTGAEQEPKPGMEAESEPIYSYGQSQARHGMTTTQHNPFENSYEDDDAGAFDNPFERDQARGQDGGYRQSASERRGMYGPVSTRGE